MGSLRPTVTISDRAKALFVMEAQRKELFQEASGISDQQKEALSTLARLSRQHEVILIKMAALEVAANQL